MTTQGTSNMFTSTFCYRGEVNLPAFSGTRVMMMPVRLGHIDSVPPDLAHYKDTIDALFRMGGHAGGIGYITIDEKTVHPGCTHRRAGLHVDGVYQGRVGAWGGGGGWGSVGNGMLTVSSHPNCRAWLQAFDGFPGDEGEADHLIPQCRDETSRVFAPGDVYWLDGLCVHESLPATTPIDRQFVRLSLPSNGPWFEGYSVNPLGVLPSGPVLPRRTFMDTVS